MIRLTLTNDEYNTIVFCLGLGTGDALKNKDIEFTSQIYALFNKIVNEKETIAE